MKRNGEMVAWSAVRDAEQVSVEDGQADRLVLISESAKTRFQVVPQATDIMALSWKLVEDPKATPRYADAMKEKQQQAVARQEQQAADQQKRQKLGPVVS